MSYLGHLTHSCIIKRSVPGFSNLYQPLLGAPTQVGESVCKRVPNAVRILEETFGRNIEANGIVYFPAGVDVRPTNTSDSGTGDILTITTETGTENWHVVSVMDAAGRGRGIVAAVKRWNE